MEQIYILYSKSSPERYKIGKHTGGKSKLISRYITSIPDLIIAEFIPCPNAKAAEKELLNRLSSHRIVNSNGRRSEWVELPLSQIKEITTDVLLFYSIQNMEIDRFRKVEEIGCRYTMATLIKLDVACSTNNRERITKVLESSLHHGSLVCGDQGQIDSYSCSWCMFEAPVIIASKIFQLGDPTLASQVIYLVSSCMFKTLYCEEITEFLCAAAKSGNEETFSLVYDVCIDIIEDNISRFGKSKAVLSSGNTHYQEYTSMMRDDVELIIKYARAGGSRRIKKWAKRLSWLFC